MIKLITFADNNMTISANICVESGLRNNVDKAVIYSPEDYHKDFYKRNKSILDQERGCGYWLWKPYFIGNEVLNGKDGDVIMYCDAGVEVINNVRYITDRIDTSDIFLFGNMFKHEHWCKMDVIREFCPVRTKFNKQVQASVIFIRISDKSKKFVDTWFKGCIKPGMIDDSPSILQNHPEFSEHRHDQAILTCLAYTNKLNLHWWPAIYNGGMFTYEHTGYEDTYPAIFHHHRFRNEQYSSNAGIQHVVNDYFKHKEYRVLC